MSVNVKATPAVVITDNDTTDTAFARATTEQNYTCNEWMSGRESIAAPSGSITCGFGTISDCIGCWVESDQPVTVVLNGQDVPLNVPEGGTKARLQLDGHITSLVVNYAAGDGITDPANVVWAVWGDPVSPT